MILVGIPVLDCTDLWNLIFGFYVVEGCWGHDHGDGLAMFYCVFLGKDGGFFCLVWLGVGAVI